MGRRQTMVVIGVAVAVVAFAGVATAVRRGQSSGDGPLASMTDAALSSTTTTAPAATTATATTAPPTTAAPTTAPPATAPPPPPVLEQGAAGPEVEAVQRRLGELHLDPGPLDGRFGPATTMAVWAFQKMHGLAPDGRVTPELRKLMDESGPPPPLVAGGAPTRVEIDLPRQLLFVHRGGTLEVVTHISTGNGQRWCEAGRCGIAVTPTGDYAFTWRQEGWRTSDLGRLYNPVYFNGGIAVHGATSVPSHPASHGCVRIPMHIAEYFPSLVARGDPVHVIG